MNKTDLSIIIISYNTKKLLSKCLATIFASLKLKPVRVEVIVIDNNSSDGSVEMVKTDFSEVRLIQNKENAGFGKANNQGVEVARGETILFLNSDTEVIGTALAQLFAYFSKLPQPAIVGGKLFNSDMSPQASCGPDYSLLNIFIALFLKGDYVGITRYSPDKAREVAWVMGACFMLKKDLFLKVGGFDTSIFMYMEEIDFEYRARSQGAKIYFYPEAHFVHVGAASSGGRAQPILNVFRGFLYFYKKHYSVFETAILKFLLVLKSVLAIGLFSLLGKKYDREIYTKALKLVI